jgi:hypothetical protein
MESLDPISPAGYVEVCVWNNCKVVVMVVFGVVPLGESGERPASRRNFCRSTVRTIAPKTIRNTYPSDEQVSSECQLFVTPRLFYLGRYEFRVLSSRGGIFIHTVECQRAVATALRKAVGCLFLSFCS